jgi:hypothetical protein
MSATHYTVTLSDEDSETSTVTKLTNPLKPEAHLNI